MKRAIVIGVLLVLLLVTLKLSCFEKISGNAEVNYQQGYSESVSESNRLTKLSEKLMSEGKWQQAKEYISEAISYDMMNARACNDLAIIYKNEKLPSDSIIFYYNKAIAIYQKNPAPYINLADYLLEIKRFEDVITIINKLFESPTVNKLDTVRYKQAYDLRAEAKLELGRYEEAIYDIKKEIALSRFDEYPYGKLGLLLISAQKYQEGVLACDTAILINPKYAKASMQRGVCYYNLKKYSASLRDYNSAITLNPEASIYYYNRGVLYLDMNKKSSALTDFKKAKGLGDTEAVDYINKLEK